MKKKLTAEEEKQRNIRWIRALFLVYLLIVIKLIIFKYPMDQLRAIAATWRKDVILEGLDTANFTPFKTIRMYIDYAYMLNSLKIWWEIFWYLYHLDSSFPMYGKRPAAFGSCC